MKQHLWTSLAVSALLMTLGLESSSHAEPTPLLSNLPAPEQQLSEQSEDSQFQPSEALSLEAEGEAQANRAEEETEAAPTQIYPHIMDGQVAATLYVRNIPVLTFLGETLEQPVTEESNALPVAQVAMATLSDTEPVREAEALAEKLDEWVQTEEDAEAIALRWDKDLEYYLIKAHEQTLVVMGEDVILPDTTRNSTQDAVQATNRLRRLLGNAPPVEEIYGKPVIAPAKIPQNRETAEGELVTVKALSGWASWYGPGFHGNLTANGEIYNQHGLTAAHRTLPFGTIVRVTNMDNGRAIVVRINDRGPYIRNRIIDLSKGAAQQLGLMQSGVAPVRVEVMK